jgi:hypothetical protein
MRISALILRLLAMALVLSGAEAAQRVEQKTLAVQPGCTVRLDAYRGQINVVSGGADEVRVTVALELPETKAGQARAVLDAFTLTAAAMGNEVRFTARNPRDRDVRFAWEVSMRPQMVFTVTVPEHCHLDLQTRDGNISVDPLRGNMRARSESGTITFRRIDGTIDAATRAGDVVVSRCTGTVKLKTIQGNVLIGTVGGRAQLETLDGDIEVQTAYGAVDAATSSGDVSAGFARMLERSHLRTSLGDIHATVNPAGGFSLKASAGLGKVISKLDLATGGSRRGKVAGQYQGGGPLLDLQAGGGNVLIEAGEPVFAL